MVQEKTLGERGNGEARSIEEKSYLRRRKGKVGKAKNSESGFRVLSKHGQMQHFRHTGRCHTAATGTSVVDSRHVPFLPSSPESRLSS